MLERHLGTGGENDIWIFQRYKSIHQLIHISNSSVNCRWKALHLPVARMRMAIRSLGWTDATLSQTHGRQTLQVHRLWAKLCPQRSFGAAHEAPSAEEQVRTTENSAGAGGQGRDQRGLQQQINNNYNYKSQSKGL